MATREDAARIADILQQEFSLLQVGARVPSDQALAERFECGRGAVRGVMAGFERRGLVRRDRGAGTHWLGSGALSTVLDEVPSFRVYVRERGYRLDSIVRGEESRRAAQLEREHLVLPANSTVWKLQRVFAVEDEKIGFATSVLPLRPLPRMPQEFDGFGSIYETLCRRYGLGMVRGWQRRRPAEVAPRILAELQLPGSVPFELIESVNCSADGRPFEYARTYMRTDGPVIEALRDARPERQARDRDPVRRNPRRTARGR